MSTDCRQFENRCQPRAHSEGARGLPAFAWSAIALDGTELDFEAVFHRVVAEPLVDVVGGLIRQIGEHHREATIVQDVTCRSSGDCRAVTLPTPTTRRVYRPDSSTSADNRASGCHRHNHTALVDPQP